MFQHGLNRQVIHSWNRPRRTASTPSTLRRLAGKTKSEGKVYFRQLRLPDIGCASYIAGGEGGCAVIDPRWDAVPQYVGLARQQDLQITHIIETHTHADHVSGSTRLAARNGATILIHATTLVTYPHCDVHHNTTIVIDPTPLPSLTPPV